MARPHARRRHGCGPIGAKYIAVAAGANSWEAMLIGLVLLLINSSAHDVASVFGDHRSLHNGQVRLKLLHGVG